jgi:hypothetical protein
LISDYIPKWEEWFPLEGEEVAGDECGENEATKMRKEHT